MAKLQFHRRIEASSKSDLLYRGYSRRTTAAEPRLSEIVAEYLRIGFEVEVIEHQVEPNSCGICFEVDENVELKYCDVYVRPAALKKKGGAQ
jgi:hypothetical protein